MEFLAATLTLPATVRVSVELPPGGVLSGLTKRIRDFNAQFVLATPDDVQEVNP